MPNICTASLVVKGRKDCVDEFIRILKSEWDPETKLFTHYPRFCRIFDTEIFEYFSIDALYYVASINFTCAWSVYSCMMKGEDTYYNDHPDDEKEIKVTNLEDISKKYNLDIQIWSDEPGFGFEEHYHIVSGTFLTFKEYEYDIISLDDFKEYDDKLPISEEEYNIAKSKNEPFLYNGEHPEWEFDFSTKPKYLYLTNMVKIRDDK